MGCNTSKDAVRAVEGGGGVSLQEVTQDLTFEDIDLNDPETEKAATKIQAVFRGHKTRKEMKNEDQETQNFEEEFSPEDTELCNAATKIQASFRGHMSRKQERSKQDDEQLSEKMEKLDPKVQEEEDLSEIDLTDPDLNKAATKIQASFRGHKARREIDEPAESQ
uniref:Neuromodulin n=1 Tax=Clastoptera arizonana TaxID=38151 RepID=A0A1B6E337_9HEMI